MKIEVPVITKLTVRLSQDPCANLGVSADEMQGYLWRLVLHHLPEERCGCPKGFSKVNCDALVAWVKERVRERAATGLERDVEDEAYALDTTRWNVLQTRATSTFVTAETQILEFAVQRMHSLELDGWEKPDEDMKDAPDEDTEDAPDEDMEDAPVSPQNLGPENSPKLYEDDSQGLKTTNAVNIWDPSYHTNSSSLNNNPDFHNGSNSSVPMELDDLHDG